jgi:hypothetical protein
MLANGSKGSRNPYREVISRNISTAALSSFISETSWKPWNQKPKHLSNPRPWTAQASMRGIGGCHTMQYLIIDYKSFQPNHLMTRGTRGIFTLARDTSSSESDTEGSKPTSLDIPTNLRQKIVSPSDAVSLVRNGDTISVSGYVCQGKDNVNINFHSIHNYID